MRDPQDAGVGIGPARHRVEVEQGAQSGAVDEFGEGVRQPARPEDLVDVFRGEPGRVDAAAVDVLTSLPGNPLVGAAVVLGIMLATGAPWWARALGGAAYVEVGPSLGFVTTAAPASCGWAPAPSSRRSGTRSGWRGSAPSWT